MKVLKRLGLGLLVVLVLFALFLAYAMSPLSIPTTSNYQIDIAAVKKLANAQKGPKPSAIRAGSGFALKFPAIVVGTGYGFQGQPLEGWAFQLVYPENKTILIDAAMGKTQFDKSMSGTFKPKGAKAIQAAIEKASTVIFTHEHLDHANGLAAHPQLKTLAHKVRLTKEQVASKQFLEAGFKKEHRSLFAPLAYDKLHSLAPGVVLIKAPGHTPGSQMIYVELQDKQAFLLVGDVAWNMKNITIPRGHARLIHWLIGEDGSALTHQLRFLHDFQSKHPKVQILVSHDRAQVEQMFQQGKIQRGLQ